MPAGVIITDHEYPVRPAFSLLTKLLDDFAAKVPQTAYASPAGISFPEAASYLQKYQDPRQADAIMRVQQELDETKIVLVRPCPRWSARGSLMWGAPPVAAQDDRVRARARREAQRPRRPLERALRAEQDVLQDGEEGAPGPVAMLRTAVAHVCCRGQQNSCCVVM